MSHRAPWVTHTRRLHAPARPRIAAGAAGPMAQPTCMMDGMSNVNGASGPGSKVLVRSRTNRVLSGVCGGLAEYLGLDATVVRVLVVVVAIFTGGFGVLAYLAMWLVIPEEGEKSSIAQDLINQTRPRP
jgi:phage shock protein C